MKIKPQLIKGQFSSDERGLVFHNNSFDLSQIKRIYKIKNKNINLNRGWKAHKIEKRWFMAVSGEISIKVLPINEIEMKIYDDLKEYNLSSRNMDILYVPEDQFDYYEKGVLVEDKTYWASKYVCANNKKEARLTTMLHLVRLFGHKDFQPLTGEDVIKSQSIDIAGVKFSGLTMKQLAVLKELKG